MGESEVAQSCPTLCDPVDYSPPGSSVHGILQARILEWVAISFSRGLKEIWATRDKFGWGHERVVMLFNPNGDLGRGGDQEYDIVCLHAKPLQLCLTLYDPMDCSPPGPSVHGILQARILEWVGYFLLQESSWPGNWTCVLSLLHWQADSLPLCHLGSPNKVRGASKLPWS